MESTTNEKAVSAINEDQNEIRKVKYLLKRLALLQNQHRGEPEKVHPCLNPFRYWDHKDSKHLLAFLELVACYHFHWLDYTSDIEGPISLVLEMDWDF
ncbi:hypothetical protein L914_05254 [Phytophthora nicotianae]|uniref:Uncharacterized protein n=1 Tax=Phytophthora nicotianae TaxID=4792 RepID=W2NSF3_PHYNI|nr:hypothetical protein L914_05254 [Phytophthora nicotianae]